MKPKLVELLFASRYTMVPWLLLAAYFYYKVSPVWDRLGEAQLSVVFFASLWILAWLKSFPKVWRYEQAKRAQAAPARDPDEVQRRRRLERKQLFVMVAILSWWWSLWWLSDNSYEDKPGYYQAAVLVAAGLSLWGLTIIIRRLWAMLRRQMEKIPRRPEKAFIVQWCQPVPKRAPQEAQIRETLPDYCKLVLTVGQPQEQPQSSETFGHARPTPVYP